MYSLKLLKDTPGAIFRMYMAAVLVQFSILSFAAVPLCPDSTATQMVHDLILSCNYWIGAAGMFGAVSLVFRTKFKNWGIGVVLGDLVAAAMFVLLSYEYLTSKPPIYAGAIMMFTAAIFLIGGLFCERRDT
jgi:hypothetical protein